MGLNSKISWTDHTFNPWWGCDERSPACDECYARTFATRLGFDIWGADKPRRFFGDAHWNEPRKWNRIAGETGTRPFVFCASMADIGEQRPDLVEHQARMYALIDECSNLTWLLLSKLPRGVLATMPDDWRDNPRPHVMFGFTADNQLWFERRLELFLRIPTAAPSFISFEPLLGPVDPSILLPINRSWWYLVGGESGHKARPMHPDWVRALRDHAIANGIPFHFKQWGEWAPGECVPDDGRYATRCWFDGRFDDCSDDWMTEADHGPLMYRLGKKAAGHRLDGQEWHERPQLEVSRV